ncbi:MAG: transketolase [Chlorobi bacterium]|nr:transketolase [Chlorobiota bacterium]
MIHPIPRTSDVGELRKIAAQVRRDILKMTYLARSGHPGGSLGATDYLVALHFAIMDINPPHFDMDGIGEDIFILSNGHICPAWYSILARLGYFPLEELATFRKLHSRLQGHPATLEGLPGVRVATGSLGQGFSVAIGAALAKRLNNDPHKVFVLMGDGEIQEGQIWEGVAFASHHKVDNLIAAVDWNNQQIDGPVERVMSVGDLPTRFKALNWHVIVVNDGNDMQEVLEALRKGVEASGKGKPVVLLLRTHMGYPVDFMLDNHKWHGVPPNKEQLEEALKQIPETFGDFPLKI